MHSGRIRTPGSAPRARGGARTAPRTARVAALAAAALLATVVPSAQAVAAPAAVVPRIDLTVLVVDDGGSAVGAITAELKGSGVAYRRIDLNDPNRPVLDAAFLSDTLDGRPRAKYQGVVLPRVRAPRDRVDPRGHPARAHPAGRRRRPGTPSGGLRRGAPRRRLAAPRLSPAGGGGRPALEDRFG
ncbi:hypothetical protein ACWCQ0_47040, partial [Streptomyces massasporeus]